METLGEVPEKEEGKPMSRQEYLFVLLNTKATLERKLEAVKAVIEELESAAEYD